MRGERPPSTSGPRPAEDLPVDPDSAAPCPPGRSAHRAPASGTSSR